MSEISGMTYDDKRLYMGGIEYMHSDKTRGEDDTDHYMHASILLSYRLQTVHYPFRHTIAGTSGSDRLLPPNGFQAKSAPHQAKRLLHS